MNAGSRNRLWMEYHVGSWRHGLIWQEVKSLGRMGSEHWEYVLLEWDGGFGDGGESRDDGARSYLNSGYR
jgi:hypothetical protein